MCGDDGGAERGVQEKKACEEVVVECARLRESIAKQEASVCEHGKVVEGLERRVREVKEEYERAKREAMEKKEAARRQSEELQGLEACRVY